MENDSRQWFREAKLGIFMHWGIYGVLGVTESWSFYDGGMDHDTYMKQCEGFGAENYDPKKWAELFWKAGARYTVLTAKHHDGVALWDTKAGDLSVVHKTPAGRDLIGPYCEAMQKKGIKVGLYFSHLDWNHPDYPSIHPQSDEWWATSPYTAPQGDAPDDAERWEHFLQFHRTQLTELLTEFGKVDLLWFDGDWERSAEQWRFKEMREYIRTLSPDTIVNSRMQGYGDYSTPEQCMPTIPPQGDWEFCMTAKEHWGYYPTDDNYKSVRQIVRIFTECLSMGGNLLLGIGPKPDGTIPEKDEKLLLELGEWIRQNEEAVYGTVAGLPAGFFTGGSVLSKDRRNLYLFYHDYPAGALMVKGIRNKVQRITVLGKGEELKYRMQGGSAKMSGLLYVDLPREQCSDICTVLKLELDGELDLYVGVGGGVV